METTITNPGLGNLATGVGGHRARSDTKETATETTMEHASQQEEKEEEEASPTSMPSMMTARLTRFIGHEDGMSIEPDWTWGCGGGGG